MLEDQGDPWAFIVVFDRIFVLALLGIVYFRFGPPNTWGLVALFAVAIGLFVYTTPNRFGSCVGLVHGVLQRSRTAASEGENDVSSR